MCISDKQIYKKNNIQINVDSSSSQSRHQRRQRSQRRLILALVQVTTVFGSGASGGASNKKPKALDQGEKKKHAYI